VAAQASHQRICCHCANLPTLACTAASGWLDADLVPGGNDILAAGIEQNLSVRILSEHSVKFLIVLNNHFKK